MKISSFYTKHQRGTVAIIVGLALPVLIGFAGLALDLGRLYVEKTELQNAADACALAAARELTCDTAAGACSAIYLQNAETAGLMVAQSNLHDFQGAQISNTQLSASDILFSTNFASGYAPRLGGADVASKYVKCIGHQTGIIPWFMQVLGVGSQRVESEAVATLAPGQSFCSAAPIGICKKSGSSAPAFGYLPGEWISSSFTSASNSDDLAGNFNWVDFTPNAGGNSEIRDQLANGSSCDIKIGNNVQQPGTQQGAKAAYNTRFGMYASGANAYTPQTAPPDRTGYAYPNKAPGSPVIPISTSAYNDYRIRQAAYTPFSNSQYGVSGPGGNISGSPATSADHASYGSDRRLVAAPIIDCAAGNTVPIVGMACVLMLNPMSNGASGTMYLEYLGQAASPTSPCGTMGGAGGPASGGPLVPTLVQ